METRRLIAWLWLLSGVPVGVALIFMPSSVLLWCFALFIVLDEAHNMAPIALAWSHGEFRRQVIYRQPWKFIGLPAATLALMLTIGTVTTFGWTSYAAGPNLYRLSDWTNLMPVMMWIYWPWKIYHFGMQNFGVMQLLRVGRRRLNMAVCLAVTFFGMAILPALTGSRWVFLMMLAVFSVNHWVTDIGLSAIAIGKRWWLLVGALLLIGGTGFVWLVPTSEGMLMRVIPIVICLRLATGFNHFYPYSRCVWKRDSPILQTLMEV